MDEETDAILVVAESLRMSAQDGSDVKDNLYKVKDVHGTSGTLTMDSDGVVRSITESMYQYLNGTMVKALKWG